jgi:hypothetical protein
MLTRQAGGWGNFHVVSSFKFLAFHIKNCGPEYIGLVHEDDTTQEQMEKLCSPMNEKQFLEKTKDLFPSFERAFSDGKNFDDFENLEELKKEWHRRKIVDANESIELLTKNKKQDE